MNTGDLSLFIHTADTGSITRAAEQLDITSAAASAALKRLEKQLETQLFIRSTRQLRITAEGERFLVYCRKAMSHLDEGKASIHALHGKIAGELRISAPSDLGRNLVIYWMDEIMEEHPDLSINLTLGDSIVDFYLERVDLAIRYGNQEDSSMVALKLASIDRVLCASPDYIAKYGMPLKLKDLLKHNCLLFQMNDRTDDLWEFMSIEEGKKEKLKIKVSSNRCANDGDVVRRWAISGKGIAYMPRLAIARDLHAGHVVRLLPKYQSPFIEFNLMSPSRKQITPAALLFRDILKENFAKLIDL